MKDEDVLPLESTGDAPGRNRLAGRKIVVIGGGQQTYGLADPKIGNGRAISVLAAMEGAEVAVGDIDPDAAAGTVEAITDRKGSGFPFMVNAADPAGLVASLEEAAERLGRVDGMVVNVGIGRGAGMLGTSAEQWDEVFGVNVRAHFVACQVALRTMAPGSSVVLTSSVGGVFPAGPAPAYNASKAALLGVSQYAAREGAPKRVRVNLVLPGLIDTPLGWSIRPDRDASMVPLGRQGTAWEVAYATVFLLSDEAAFVTGQSIVVDGGMVTLRMP